MKLIFVVPGAPVAKGRARSTMRGGFIRHYTPAKTRAYEELVATCASNAMREASLKMQADIPIEVTVHFEMPIPKSWSKLKKKIAAGGMPHIVKPDASNLFKSVEDGCNGVVWKDDCVVWHPEAFKTYSEDPKATVIVSFSEFPF